MKRIYFVVALLFSMQFATAGIVKVTNTKDSGEGSLRWAISTAVSGDTIEVDKFLSLSGDTIVLQSSIRIDREVKLQINGNGISIYSSRYEAYYVIFEIENNLADISFHQIHFLQRRSSNSSYGSIYNEGILKISSCVFSAIDSNSARYMVYGGGSIIAAVEK